MTDNNDHDQNPLSRAWLGYLNYAGLVNTIAGLTGVIVMFFAMAHRPRLESTVLKNHISLCSTEAITYTLLFGVVTIAMVLLFTAIRHNTFLPIKDHIDTTLIFKILQRTAVGAALGILGAFLGYLFDGTLYFATAYGIFILNMLNIAGLIWLIKKLSAIAVLD